MSDKELLEHCRSRIECQLGWSESSGWRNQDFETLSERIFEKTGVLLSTTTLKRIWGKLPYHSSPNTKTLNALAGFLGYESWVAFKAEEVKAESQREKPVATGKLGFRKPGLSARTILRWAMGVGLVLFLVLVAMGTFSESEKRDSLTATHLDRVRFYSGPVVRGAPNTVVFHYDVRHLPVQHVEIQQHWDANRRFAVNAEKTQITSTYAFPGYWRAKLLVNGEVIREHDLYIRSEGWLATSGPEDDPYYFSQGDLEKAGFLRVDSLRLEESRQKRSGLELLSYHYFEELGGVNSDHFTFEARLQNTYRGGDGRCQNTRLLLQFTDGIFAIPLAYGGCVGDLRLRLSEQIIEGKDYDLSAFGCDFSQWQKLRIEVRDRKVSLYRNEEEMYHAVFAQSAGQLMGFRFSFQGSGRIDDIRLWDENDRLVWEEGF